MALYHGCSNPVNANTQVTYTGPKMQSCHLPHVSDPAVSAGTDPPTGTLIQRCRETGMRGMDIRVLCPPRARPPHGHAAPGMGSSRFSASLVILPALHEPSLDDSNGDADSKVYAHPPCPIQIITIALEPMHFVSSRMTTIKVLGSILKTTSKSW